MHECMNFLNRSSTTILELWHEIHRTTPAIDGGRRLSTLVKLSRLEISYLDPITMPSTVKHYLCIECQFSGWIIPKTKLHPHHRKLETYGIKQRVPAEEYDLTVLYHPLASRRYALCCNTRKIIE